MHGDVDGVDVPGSQQEAFAKAVADAEAAMHAGIEAAASFWQALPPVQFKSVVYRGDGRYAPTIKVRFSRSSV
jgi:hypothetical protein